MAKEDKDKKREEEIKEEKKFLQTRWKSLKDEDEDKDEVKEEKSYISARWKHLQNEQKNLKTLLNSKAIKSAPKASPSEIFAKRFNHNKKSFQEAFIFLKNLAEDDEKKDEDKYDHHEEENRHKAYHLGRMMEKAIGEIFGGKSMDEQLGKKELAKLLIKHKDLSFPELNKQDDESNVTHPDGDSKYKDNDPLQQFGEGGSLTKKGNKKALEFSELKKQDDEVNITNDKKNPDKVAKLGEDVSWNPVEDGPSLVRNKKGLEFPELSEADDAVNVTEGSNKDYYTPGKEEMQLFGQGGSLVKFLKTIGDAAVFLKRFSFEKTFGMNHKSIANQLVKEMEKPFVAEFESTFPGDLSNLLQEEDEPEHKKSKKDKNLNTKDMMDSDTDSGMSGMGGAGTSGMMGMAALDLNDEDMGGSLSGDLMEDEDEDKNHMFGQKSLDHLYQDSLRTTQSINALNQSLNGLLAQLS